MVLFLIEIVAIESIALQLWRYPTGTFLLWKEKSFAAIAATAIAPSDVWEKMILAGLNCHT